jgi:hypothetical protein
MNSMKKIVLTFDYEPFLGAKSGSAKKCILDPTEALRVIMTKYNAKAIFFVDVLYLLNLRKYPILKNTYEELINQLKMLHQEGHYIFPHIHPHWLDASYLENKNEFSLTNLTSYSLASLQNSQIKKLFQESIQFLKDLGVSYDKWGYRAGGWCIQPFGLYKDIFLSEKIRYEFSVLPGYKNDNPNQAFDFSMIKENEPYFFSDLVEINNTSGDFIEFPISTIQINAISGFKDKLVRKYLWKTNDRGFGDGKSAQTAALKSNFIDREMISLDILTIAKLSGYKKYLKKQTYMHWISHPKMFTRHGLKMFDNFLDFASTNFDVIYDFKKMIPKK